MKRSMIVCLFSIFAVVPFEQVHALACDENDSQPFLDVDLTDNFCTDTVWAKNANVTLGCGDGTNFCPADNVSRAQMVLFLRRMAYATFPATLMAESSATPSGDLDTTGVTACSTTAVPTAGLGIPATHVVAVVSLQGGADPAEVQMSVTHGATGVGLVFPDNFVNVIVTVPPGQWVNASLAGFLSVLPIPAGDLARWRINLSRAPGSATTGEIAGLRCQLKVFGVREPA